MTPASEHTCKLFAIIARNAPIAAVFRTGEDGLVRLIRWNLQDDSLDYGEFFAGTIFARRSDLSPDGKKLLYFASQSPNAEYHPTFTSTWTAISTVPWLTPIVVWAKGDRVAGGGLFHDDRHVWLNHRAHQSKFHDEHALPDSISFNTNQWATGDDYPIYANRLERDGWRYNQHGDFRLRNGVWVAEREEVCTKADATKRYEIEMTLYGFEKRSIQNLLHYRFLVRDLVSGHSIPLDCDDWADWDKRGRLICSKGSLLLAGFVQPTGWLDMDVIADFALNQPDEGALPPDAVIW